MRLQEPLLCILGHPNAKYYIPGCNEGKHSGCNTLLQVTMVSTVFREEIFENIVPQIAS